MSKMLRTALVVTGRGILDAYRVKVGDVLLCADGIMRKVESVEKMSGKVYELKGHGHPNLNLPDGQRILATTYDRKEAERNFKPFSFVNPNDMKGYFWASPKIFPNTDSELTPDEAWICGLAMATGPVSGKSPVLVHVHESKRETVQYFAERLNLKYFATSFHTQYQYQINSPKLMKWMSKNLSQTLGRKVVPMEILGAARNIRKAFFDGYVFGRGTFEDDKYRFSADNKMEAISMKLLAQTINYSTALYYSETKSEEGVKEYWQIVAEKTARSSVEIGRNRCGLVRDIEFIKKDKALVSINVIGNSSLVVDGLIFE